MGRARALSAPPSSRPGAAPRRPGAAPAAGRLRAALGVLGDNVRDPDLRRAQAAFALAWLAEWASTVGIGIVAFRDGGALAVGLVGLLRMLPAALLAPFVSAFADRVRRERVLVRVALARAVAFGLVAALVAQEAAAGVYVLVVVASVLGVIYRPVHSALLPSLCHDAQQLTGANATRGLLDSVAVFLGPLIAAALLGLGSLPGVFVAAAVLSAVSAACVLGVQYEATPREPDAAPQRVLAEARDGVTTVLGQPGLRLLFGLAAVQIALRGALSVFVVVLAIDVLDAGEAAVGGLTGAVGAGAVVGSLAAFLLSGSRHLAAWFGLGVALWGLPIALTGAAPSLLSTVLLLALVGVGNALVDIALFTLPPRLVADRLLARVFGVLEALGALAVALGALAAPLVIDLVGARGAVAVLGALPPLAVAWAWTRLRRLDDAMVERDARVALLVGVDLLRPLPMPAIEDLAGRLEAEHVAAGTDVVVQGDEGRTFFILERGSAEVLHDGELIRELGPGDSFGEVALLRDAPRSATVHARTDLQVWELRREQLLLAVEGFASSRAEAEALLGRLLFVPAPRATPGAADRSAPLAQDAGTA